MSERTPEDGPSVLEQITDRLGGADSPTKRTLDGECDGCGTSEGSLVTSKADGWKLCRPCFNDPEVRSEVVDG